MSVRLHLPLRRWVGLRGVRLVGATLVLLGSQSAAEAESADQFFRGRQLTLYIGGGVGGSIDLHARLVARHIVRYLPGSPVIVPRNLPAAGGVQAFMALATTAARDGSAFAISARGPLTDPLYTDKVPAYDVTKFNWIGSLNDDSTICYTRKASEVRTLAEARQREITMASTGVLAESAKFPTALNATLGTKFKVISGYSGTANTLLAVERGETEGRCTTIGSLNATQPGALLKGDINVLVQVGIAKRPELASIPLAIDEATTDQDRAFLKLLVGPLAIASAFTLPPDVPSDRIDVWRKALAAMLTDAQFLDEAKAINLEITARSGPEVENIIRSIYSTPRSVIERARKIFEVMH